MVLSPFLHLWPRKLGPFDKRAARPSLIITSLSNFKQRRKNRRVGYKWALSLSWPIRYTNLEHVTFSNKSSACTGQASLPCSQITCFRENNGCCLDFEKGRRFRNRGGIYFEFCKVNCVNGRSDKNSVN